MTVSPILESNLELSVLHLAQSSVMKKETLQKSLTPKAWIKLIRCSSLQVLDEVDKERERKREELKVLVKILHYMKLGELSPLLGPLLDLICESNPGLDDSECVRMTCPCRPEPHFISPQGFLLLEEVEAAFGTAEQSLMSIGSFGAGWRCTLIPAVQT